MPLNPQIFIEELRFGPRKLGAMETMVHHLRTAAFKAEAPSEMVYMAMPAYVAKMIADKIELETDRLLSKARFERELEAIAEAAENIAKDEILRFTMATTDLELLLMQFIGRPPMTMEEVRQQRDQMRPGGPGPQPFIRNKSNSIPVSDSLARSLRSGRIGNPREPGEDG